MLTSLALLFVATTATAVQTGSLDTLSAPAAVAGDPDVPADSGAVLSGPRQAWARAAVSRASRPPSSDTGARLSVVGAAEREGAVQRRAIERSDWYYRRLAIHRAASYATVPLFVAEYVVGDKLFDGNASSGTKSTHEALATGIGVLFGVNTITGAWNLWDTRHESQGRARRMTHAALMLLSDAGFVATASLAPEGEDDDGGSDDGGSSGRNRHRTAAIGSMGVSLASYLMMYLWK